ncbi:hypothetical protein ACFCX4_09085 [Kitasatospora sp. NPDC056327]|uniref:hypothetical protein n=1 Tax=Kitasatospora sp. NPDC056327 TaxID=3345785 RepID=UPI0035DE40D0
MSRPSKVARPTEDAALARVSEPRKPSVLFLLLNLRVAVRRRDRCAVELIRALLARAARSAVPA